MDKNMQSELVLLQTQTEDLFADFKNQYDHMKRFTSDTRKQYKKIEDEEASVQDIYSTYKVKLDIGGNYFSTSVQTLTKFPDSMFGAMFSGRYEIEYDDDSCVFIDRDGTHFRYILNFLRDGHIDLPQDPQIHLELLREAEYYQINPLVKYLRSGELSCTNKINARPKYSFNNGLTEFNFSTYGTWSTMKGSVLVTGAHIWTIKIKKFEQIGDNGIEIGVCQQSVPGNRNLSYQYKGWGYIASGSKSDGGAVVPYGEPYGLGDQITVYLDLDNGILSFAKNGDHQGVAFNDVTGPVCIAVSSSAKICSLGILPDEYGMN
eukprot:TRINITY_DN475_c0_g3_i4.p1 TRINITY_DN475_c0_g3~~TRINITY_DN475_c0_g3_i4.p1  ORF type:complete len:319 (+),score=62.65 TRINITY_DN475_c0_g3_i4:606-1562(+)